jgi:hypothetical protein
MTIARRLSEEEIEVLIHNYPGANHKEAIRFTFEEYPYEETYDFCIGYLTLDASLFRWNEDTVNAIRKGYDLAFGHITKLKVK